MKRLVPLILLALVATVFAESGNGQNGGIWVSDCLTKAEKAALKAAQNASGLTCHVVATSMLNQIIISTMYIEVSLRCPDQNGDSGPIEKYLVKTAPHFVFNISEDCEPSSVESEN